MKENQAQFQLTYTILIEKLGLPTEIKVQTSKSYETCKDKWKLCYTNQTDQTCNPASYLKSMQNVGFEQTSATFIEIFVA